MPHFSTWHKSQIVPITISYLIPSYPGFSEYSYILTRIVLLLEAFGFMKKNFPSPNIFPLSWGNVCGMLIVFSFTSMWFTSIEWKLDFSFSFHHLNFRKISFCSKNRQFIIISLRRASEKCWNFLQSGRMENQVNKKVCQRKTFLRKKGF